MQRAIKSSIISALCYNIKAKFEKLFFPLFKYSLRKFFETFKYKNKQFFLEVFLMDFKDEKNKTKIAIVLWTFNFFLTGTVALYYLGAIMFAA